MWLLSEGEFGSRDVERARLSRKASIAEWRVGGNGKESSWAVSPFETMWVMRVGTREAGSGWRVRAEYAVEKLLLLREAWKRETRRGVVWSVLDDGMSWRETWAKEAT